MSETNASNKKKNIHELVDCPFCLKFEYKLVKKHTSFKIKSFNYPVLTLGFAKPHSSMCIHVNKSGTQKERFCLWQMTYQYD